MLQSTHKYFLLCACLILPRSYKDNGPCVEMISGRVGDMKYLSMFSILDEQSSLPKCTDITLVDAYHKQFAAHPNYEKPRFGKESFIVKHFAGSVMCAVYLPVLYNHILVSFFISGMKPWASLTRIGTRFARIS